MDLGNILSAGVTEWIKELFARVFGDNAALATVLISIVPIIELKGAIPFGMSTAFWGEHALSGGAALGCGILGGLIVAILLSFLLEPLVRWLKSTKLFKRLIERFEHSVREKAEKMECEGKAQSSPRKKTFYKMLGVFLFVAVPLPLTGVWTGTAIAVFAGLKFWQSILAAFAGNVVAGLLISFVCTVFPAFTTLLFYLIIAIVLMVVVYKLIKGRLYKQN